MGAYLNKPIVEKVHDEGTGTGFKYGCTSMQGWRVNQEDAHNCVVDISNGWHMFAVYDGHGGSEVSKYTAEKFPDFVKDRKFWDASAIEECLQKAFIDFDDFLRSDKAKEDLLKLANADKPKSNHDSEDEADRIETIEEKAIPLDELIKRYGADRESLRKSVLSAFFKQNEDDEDEDEDSDVEEELNEENGDGNQKKIMKRSCESPIKNNPKKAKSDTNLTDEKPSAENEKNDKDIKEEKEATNGEATASGATTTDDDEDDDGDKDFVADESEEDEEICDEEGEIDDGMFMADVPGCDSGTTACVCFMSKDKVIVANAGDSRAVLCRSGKAIDLSVDHKPEDESETTRIQKAGGRIEDGRVNGGLNLSRALGDHSYKKNDSLELKDQMITALPDVKVETLTNDDEFLIVACDGIWNSMESQEVVDFAKKLFAQGKTCTEVCDALCDNCLADSTEGDGTGCDNMTVICTQFVR